MPLRGTQKKMCDLKVLFTSSGKNFTLNQMNKEDIWEQGALLVYSKALYTGTPLIDVCMTFVVVVWE